MAKGKLKPTSTLATKKPAIEENDFLDEPVAEEVEVVAEEAKVESDVQVLSLRPGDIVLSSGILRYKETMKLPREAAEALTKQFQDVRII